MSISSLLVRLETDPLTYVVKFWSESLGAIEIIGGEIYEDKKNKVTTVIFTDENCLNMNTGEFIAVVNFELRITR